MPSIDYVHTNTYTSILAEPSHAYGVYVYKYTTDLPGILPPSPYMYTMRKPPTTGFHSWMISSRVGDHLVLFGYCGGAGASVLRRCVRTLPKGLGQSSLVSVPLLIFVLFRTTTWFKGSGWISKNKVAQVATMRTSQPTGQNGNRQKKEIKKFLIGSAERWNLPFWQIHGFAPFNLIFVNHQPWLSTPSCAQTSIKSGR